MCSTISGSSFSRLITPFCDSLNLWSLRAAVKNRCGPAASTERCTRYSRVLDLMIRSDHDPVVYRLVTEVS